MNAGKLRYQYMLLDSRGARSPSGDQLDPRDADSMAIGSVRACDIRELSASEQVTAGRRDGSRTFEIHARYAADLVKEKLLRLRFGGETIDVAVDAVQHDPRRGETKATVVHAP